LDSDDGLMELLLRVCGSMLVLDQNFTRSESSP
ncbi:hypothetical protein A2U01_0104025, partial [Trifolium medium]|nr:hypothetical protein [Trifolium medium]